MAHSSFALGDFLGFFFNTFLSLGLVESVDVEPEDITKNHEIPRTIIQNMHKICMLKTKHH